MNRCLATLATLIACSALAEEAKVGDITIRDAWVRGTVSGQKVTGLFMRIDSPSGATLVAASSPVAGTSEIHESIRDKEVAKMRPVARIELPPGKPVEFRPGGYHVMLIDLKKTLTAGDRIPVKLRFEQAGRPQELEIRAEVRPLGASGEHAGTHSH